VTAICIAWLKVQKHYVLPTESAFVCFVRISEGTAITFLYSVNLLTETEYVYFGVRTGSLNVIQVGVKSVKG
jgi:hypothetical protein